jgi:hypothetical protein
VSLDVIYHHFQLGKFHLNDLRITKDRLQRVKSLVGTVDPNKKFTESVLELAKTQQSLLKFFLPIANGSVQIIPPMVDLS